MNDPRPLAAIDLGTNSFHLVIARPTGNSRFEVIDRDKEVVRLGSGSGDMKALAPDAIDRGVAALARFARLARSAGAEVHAVATSAVREAENRDELLRRARDEAGVDVKVVSGVEEARLIHLGVLQSVPVYDDRHLVIDIGGGSTELVVGEAGDVLEARSVKLGAIRLTERFFRDEPLRPRQLEDCRTYVRAFLAPTAEVVGRLGFDVAVGSSGTIISAAEMARSLRGEAPLTKVAGSTLGARDLDAVVAALAGAPTVAERERLTGLDPRRADIILAGVVILEQAFRSLDIREMVIADFALREGVLLDALQRRDRTSNGHLRDLRYESVAHLASIAPGERQHCAQAAELAQQLYEGTAHLHRLAPGNEELLEAAALLANVGLFISHDKHHLHSYYVIRNADALAGFTDDEVEVIAQAARYHRKSAPKASHDPYARLDAATQRTVRVLAGILRIAFALDRTRRGAVSSVTVEDDGGEGPLRLVLGVRGDASLERYTAEARSGLLAQVLERSITFGESRGRNEAAAP